jgi:glycosyltransferase
MSLKISIITVCYNSAKTIEKTIQSVLSQTYGNIEYVIIDGKSNDDTLSIVKKYEDKITWISEADKGLYDAINKGLKIASGDVIGLMHSDDVFASDDVLSVISETFQKDNCNGTYGDLVYTKQDDIDEVVRYWKSKKFIKSLLKKGWMPAHPTLFLKKEVYDKYVGFNLKYKIAADYDFVTRVFSDDEFKFSYIPRIITKMRLGGASNASITHIIQKSKEDFKIIKSNKIGNFITLLLKNIGKITQFTKK